MVTFVKFVAPENESVEIVVIELEIVIPVKPVDCRNKLDGIEVKLELPGSVREKLLGATIFLNAPL
jgi:hypothetical protein